MAIWLVWYRPYTVEMDCLWGVYLSEENARAAAEIIEQENYGTEVHINPEIAI